MNSTDLLLIPVRADDQIDLIDSLARIIWEEHFPSMISEEQIRYMLHKFQSESAIRRQIDEGFFYYLLDMKDYAAGYFAIKPDHDHKSIFLSKMYLLPGFRGKGLPRIILNFIQSIGFCYGFRRVYLTVNKQNTAAIRCYEKNLFRKTDSLHTDIGNGFFMDDYLMETSH